MNNCYLKKLNSDIANIFKDSNRNFRDKSYSDRIRDKLDIWEGELSNHEVIAVDIGTDKRIIKHFKVSTNMWLVSHVLIYSSSFQEGVETEEMLADIRAEKNQDKTVDP